MACSRLRVAAGFAASLVLSGMALAGRPLQSEDAGVLARGECELEGAGIVSRSAAGRLRHADLQLGCGLGWNNQLALAVAREKDEAGDNPHPRALSLGGKMRLWRASGEDSASALVLAWSLEGSASAGTAWRHTGRQFNLALSRPLGPTWTMHGNLGHVHRRQDKRRSTTWALAIEHLGLGGETRWSPMAEVFGDDRDPAWWNLGLRVAVVPEKFFLDASYGRQFTRSRTDLVTLGFKAAF